MKRVLVTGAMGCIGSWVVRNLIDQKAAAIVVFDLATEPKRLRLICSEDDLRRVTFVAGDVTDVGALSRTIDQHGIDALIHLAALQVPSCKADPIRGAKANVLGTLAVFEAVKATRGRI